MEIKPLCVNDITASNLFDYQNKESIICVGSKKADKYFYIPEKDLPDHLAALQLMDGQRTLGEIKSALAKRCDTAFVDKLYRTCLQCGFIINSDDYVKPEFNELKVTYISVATLKIGAFSSLCSRIPSWVFFVVFTLSGILLLASFFKAPAVLTTMPWRSILGDPRSILYAFLISTVSVLLHEMGHVVAASKLGVKVAELELSTFSFMSFGCYARLPGIYFLKPRNRIIIWAAGACINLVLVAIGILGFAFFGADNTDAKLFFTVFIISNLSLIMSALMPFYISDGYFILATLCKTPNLRKNVFTNIIAFFSPKARHKMKAMSGIYLLYFLVSVAFIVAFFVLFLFPLLGTVFVNIMSGQSFQEILQSNLSASIAIGLVIVSRLVGVVIGAVGRHRERTSYG